MSNKCKLCPNKIISEGVAFDGTTVIVSLPEGCYRNRETYCIVIAQKIPDDTLVTADVAFIIGKDDTVLYPFTNCDCSKITACSLRTRTMYRTQLVTSDTGATFRFAGRLSCGPNYDLPSIGGKDVVKVNKNRGIGKKRGDE